MQTDASQVTEARRFVKLAVVGLIAAVRIMQIVIGRDGKTEQVLADATLLHGHATVAGGWAATHIGTFIHHLEPLCLAVQVPFRTPPSHPQAPLSGHELGGV
jgi:hypothetical protein